MLVTNPAERIDLHHLLRNEWLKGPEKLGKKLPVEFLSIAPSENYINNSIFNANFDFEQVEQ